MGPDCGTAIVNGVPLGFANVVRRGDIGLVAASGTGLQEVTCRIHNLGRRHFAGARHRRPRSEGGDRRHHDAAGARARWPPTPATRVIVLISKPPSPAIARADRGGGGRRRQSPSSCIFSARRRSDCAAGMFAATSLRHAADVAVALARGEPAPTAIATPADAALAAVEQCAATMAPTQTRGSRALHRRHVLLRGAARVHRPRPACRSNAPAKGAAPFDGRFDGHVFLDLGDDDYTRGRPHPMIDPSLRDAAVRTQGADPQTAAILFDVVLGFGSHDNPAGGLAQALADAQREARAHGRTLALIGHVCGTDGDPQDKAAQVRQLEAAGALVVDSNVEAAWLAAHLATGSRVARDATRSTRMSTKSLFKETLTVVNVGLKGFGDDIVAAGGQCVALEWQPPAQGDREGGWALAEILNHPAVEAANAIALARFIAANPVLTDVAAARDVLPGMAGDRRLIVHAGPPIAWPAMCGPMRGAVLGAVVLEGWADSVDAAERLVARGGVELEPCHHHAAVGPMAGIISPSMPVFVVENKAAGNRAYCNFNEGLGKVLRFGANGPEVIARLRMMAARRRADAARRAGAQRSDRAEAADGAGAQHGRRGAQPQRRGDGAASSSASPPALIEADVARQDAAATLGLHRRQRPLLSQPVDGRVQGDVRRGGGRGGQLDGDGDGAQRRQLRRAPVGHRRRLVRGAGQSGRRALLSRLLDRRCRGRPRRFGDHRDRRRRRLRDGGGAGDRQVRRRHADRRDPSQPAHARDHARRQSVVHAAGARLRRGRRPASTRARWSTAACCRSSTAASRTARPASARSAPASPRAPMACFTAAVKALARNVAEAREVGMTKPLAVVAVGGNALILDDRHMALADQYDAVCETASHVAAMIGAGWNVVLTHGNGPQVGFILRRSEIADGQVPTVPVQYAVGDTQGAIGFMFQNALGNALSRRGIRIPVVTLVTQTLVDRATRRSRIRTSRSARS